jgi:hypothetical protein
MIFLNRDGEAINIALSKYSLNVRELHKEDRRHVPFIISMITSRVAVQGNNDEMNGMAAVRRTAKPK